MPAHSVNMAITAASERNGAGCKAAKVEAIKEREDQTRPLLRVSVHLPIRKWASFCIFRLALSSSVLELAAPTGAMSSIIRRRSKDKHKLAESGGDLEGFLRESRKGTEAVQASLDAAARGASESLGEAHSLPSHGLEYTKQKRV